MHEDFNKDHFKFIAGFKREGSDKVKYIPNCTTIAGYLCNVSSRKVKSKWLHTFTPIWDGQKDKDKLCERGFTMQYALEHHPDILIKFGKVEGEYWVWNLDASEKKKVEAKAEVLFIKKWKDPYDDDEDEFILVDKPFSKLVFEAIKNNCYESSHKGKTRFTLRDTANLETELNAINWTLKIKTS